MFVQTSLLRPSGGHTHPRLVLHESEAPAAVHQARNEEVPGRDRAHGGRPRADADGGVREHEPDGLRPQRGHARHARGKTSRQHSPRQSVAV